eukprot:8783679-Pyramimonas_sp.AAC.1
MLVCLGASALGILNRRWVRVLGAASRPHLLFEALDLWSQGAVLELVRLMALCAKPVLSSSAAALISRARLPCIFTPSMPIPGLAPGVSAGDGGRCARPPRPPMFGG